MIIKLPFETVARRSPHRPDRPSRHCCLDDRTSSLCGRSASSVENSWSVNLSGSFLKFATHPPDPI